MRGKKTQKVLNWLKCYPFFLLPGRIKHRSSASFFYGCHKSVPSCTDMMWELEKLNLSYCLKITVSLCACSKCACAVTELWPSYWNSHWLLNLLSVNLVPVHSMLALFRFRLLCIIFKAGHRSTWPESSTRIAGEQKAYSSQSQSPVYSH